MTSFVHALAAVLAGNAAYFLLLPWLPPSIRHLPFQLDLGLGLDFCFCLLAFLMVKALSAGGRGPKPGKG
jgi:hypothetical protein